MFGSRCCINGNGLFFADWLLNVVTHQIGLCSRRPENSILIFQKHSGCVSRN